MPTPLIAKVDRLASPAGEPPAHFTEVVATLPGLEAVHFLRAADGEQRVGIWLWRGREGMREGHAALTAAMGHLGPPPMIEERVLDVVSTGGDLAAPRAATAVIVHLGPFTRSGEREAYLANLPRVDAALRTVPGLVTSLALADPAGRDLLAVHLWSTTPDREVVRAAIAAQPAPPGLDTSLLADPGYVERYEVMRSIRPAVAA